MMHENENGHGQGTDKDTDTEMDIQVFGCRIYSMRYWHRWAHNLKNVAPQKQNAICKTRAQYLKRNCAFELFKAHCAATINAKNASLKFFFISDP
jgi:hypothetical protein